MSLLARGLLILFVLIGPATAQAGERLVTLGGDVTEIVYALGAGGQIVAADETSLYPQATEALPKLGYLRSLSAEGIVAQSPDLVIASSDAGPPAVMDLLRGTGLRIEIVEAPDSLEGVITKVTRIGALLSREAEAAALTAKIRARMDAVSAALRAHADRPRVLFVLATGQGGLMASGRGTAADAMIAMAGGLNAITAYERYRPLTPEAAVAAAPDIILVPEHVVRLSGGIEALAALPELALTPAGQARRIVVMDSLLLLGFGPRTPQATADLAKALHPGLEIAVP